jgi:hypothetical protein
MLRGPADLRRDLARDNGVELDREIGLRLGRCSLAIARRVLRDEKEIPLQGVRRIEVGVYRVLDPGTGPNELQLAGWETVVRVREQDAYVHVLAREREERLTRLAVVVAEPEEWVLVRVSGDLEHLLEPTLELALEQGGRPALAPAVLAAYEREKSATPAS